MDETNNPYSLNQDTVERVPEPLLFVRWSFKLCDDNAIFLISSEDS